VTAAMTTPSVPHRHRSGPFAAPLTGAAGASGTDKALGASSQPSAAALQQQLCTHPCVWGVRRQLRSAILAQAATEASSTGSSKSRGAAGEVTRGPGAAMPIPLSKPDADALRAALRMAVQRPGATQQAARALVSTLDKAGLATVIRNTVFGSVTSHQRVVAAAWPSHADTQQQRQRQRQRQRTPSSSSSKQDRGHGQGTESADRSVHGAELSPSPITLSTPAHPASLPVMTNTSPAATTAAAAAAAAATTAAAATAQRKPCALAASFGPPLPRTGAVVDTLDAIIEAAAKWDRHVCTRTNVLHAHLQRPLLCPPSHPALTTVAMPTETLHGTGTPAGGEVEPPP